jgi:uncharacterized protein YoxC
MTDKQGRPYKLNIDGKNVLVGAPWNTERKQKGLLLNLSLRVKANKENRPHCAIYPLADGKSTQYLLLDEHELQDADVAADAVIAEKASEWFGIKRDAPLIFIYSHLTGNSVSSEPSFWLTIVENDNTISNTHTGLIEDRFSLREFIETLLITSSEINVISVDTDGATKAFLEDFDTEAVFKIKEITTETLTKALGQSTAKFKRIYKPSKIKIKKVGIVAGATVLTAFAAFGFSYLSQSTPFDYFDNEVRLQELKSKSSSVSDSMKEFKTGSTWDPRSYRFETMREFSENMQNSMFSPIEIAVVLREVNKTMPTLAAEWRLTKINYENNRFFAQYERIRNGQGVFFLLDKKIKKIDEETEYLTIRPYELKENAQVRTYSIIPKGVTDRASSVNELKESMREEDRLYTRMGKATQRVSSKIKALEDIHMQYSMFTFQDTWINRSSIDLYDQAIAVEEDIQRAEDTLKKSIREFRNTEKAAINDYVLLGNVLDFVSIMQMDSYFMWTYPAIDNVFPSKETLKEREGKKTRRKRKDKEQDASASYGPAIESYNVVISTRDSEEEGKVLSYGIADMLRLGLLINKPFVNVEKVEYNSLNDQWQFNIHFNRKTPDYKRRVENLTGK